MKQTLTESQLKQYIYESVKKALNEMGMEMDPRKKSKALYTELIRFCVMTFPQAIDDAHKQQLQMFVDRAIAKYPEMSVEELAERMENPNNPSCVHALMDYKNWAIQYPEAYEAKKAAKRKK